MHNLLYYSTCSLTDLDTIILSMASPLHIYIRKFWLDFPLSVFFFFFWYVHTKGEKGFELVTSASWGVIPSRLSYPLGTSLSVFSTVSCLSLWIWNYNCPNQTNQQLEKLHIYLKSFVTTKSLSITENKKRTSLLFTSVFML